MDWAETSQRDYSLLFAGQLLILPLRLSTHEASECGSTDKLIRCDYSVRGGK